MKISEYKEDNYRNDIETNGNKKPKDFRDKINAIYRRNTVKVDYQSFLFQYVWVNQEENRSELEEKNKLTANSDYFFPTLARHIYSCSFS